MDIQHEQWGQIDKDKNGTDKISSGNSGKCTWMCQNMEHNSNADASSNDRNTVTEIRLPCLLTHTSYTLKGFLLIDSLLPANNAASEIAVSKQLINKLLLEFKSDAFNKYNLLYIGGFYLLKCSSSELIHNETQKRFNLDCREVIIHGEKSLWSLSVLIKKMLSDNSLQNQSHGFCLEGRNCIPAEVFPKASPNVCENLVGWKWKFDAQLHLSADALGELKAVLGSEWIDGLVSPFQTISEICSVSSCMKFMKTTSPHPSGATRLENIVPDGTLISLHGDVMDVHFIHNSSAYSFGSKKLIGCQSSGTRYICIHVFEDNQMVKVRGIWGKSMYPVGFGPGVNATFHRLLVTCNSRRWNQLTLTPASYIVVNSIKEVFCSESERSCLQQTTIDLQDGHLFKVVPQVLLSSSNFVENKMTQIRCRVSGVLYLMLEKQTKLRRISSRKPNLRRVVNVPTAAFLLDDGSSLCCCWTDHDNAQTLLRLQENMFTTRAILKMSGSKRSLETVGSCLEKVLRKYQSIAVTNYGAVADSSCSDIVLLVNSNKTLGTWEEKLLKHILFCASGGPSFNIIGKKMEFNALEQLKQGPINTQMFKSLPVPHIWAVEIQPIDILAEARNLFGELQVS